MDEEKDELKSLLGESTLSTGKPQTNIYARRWWVLAIYSLYCFCQAMVWNTWGPITQSAEVVFNWSDGTIGMLANWGNIAYIITVFPACYFMQEKGIRISLLICGFIMLLGTALRCITSNSDYALWLMNGCAILNGIGGTVPFAGPPLVASVWFPPAQRATATATSSVFNYVGIAVASIIGPQLVASPVYDHYNHTTDILTNGSLHGSTPLYPLATTDTTNRTVVNLSTITDDIMQLMYIECGFAGLLFIASLLYFPDKPPLPPSTSASIERVDYKKGLTNIVKHGPLWLITLAYAVPAGVYGVYSSVFDVILNPVGVDQTEVGWIGFYSIIAGCVSGLVVARFSDLFMKHMKLFLVCLYVCAGGSFVWLTLICSQIIPFSTVQLYISSILGGMFLSGCTPLFYELGCEASYPVSEGVTGGLLTWVNNLSGILFLLVLLIPNIGTAWMNICLCCSIGMGLLFLILFPERYTRTDIDIKVEVDNTNTTIQSNISETTHQINTHGDVLS